MSMKGIIKYVLCTIGVVIGAILLILLCFNFAINCKKTLIDTSISPDGTYELTLIEIGEPAWPFGAASGRLILNEGIIVSIVPCMQLIISAHRQLGWRFLI